MIRKLPYGLASIALFCTALLLVGCGESTRTAKNEKKAEKKDAHSGWWCDEHGVPEIECSLCMSEADQKTKFKDKSDWCKIHDRAQSQCFKCDPTLYEKVFEPKYVAKYNEKPKRPPEEEFKK